MSGGRQPLPIDARLDDICAQLRGHRRLVVSAAPGSGKTTRIPPALVDAGVAGEVLVLEPRRLAARAAARRVAQERGGAVGAEVGYQVRDDRKVSAATRIRFVTEGILVRQLCGDPFLEGVGAVILDEFHERHLETDLALSMLVEVAETVRDDLLLLVTSATLDAAPLQRFLGDCPLLVAEGRSFPVQVEHLDLGGSRRDAPPLEEQVARGVRRVLETMPVGDLLVFLPGVREIDAAAGALRGLASRGNLQVLPLHGALPAAEQDRALRRAEDGRRRVVLSTNVAESSLTIDGVRAVVDSGLARVLHHDPGRGLDQLRVERISRAAAEQRAGRAGRLGPGRCLRLWSAAEERGLAAFELPEIRRADLTGAVLTVRAFAGRDPREFGWFEMPDAGSLVRADLLLGRLGVLGEGGAVTRLGRGVLGLPLHPRAARALLAAEPSVRAAVALTCAWLGERDPLLAAARDRVPVDLEARLELLQRAAAARFDTERCRGLGLSAVRSRQVWQGAQQLLRVGFRRDAPRLDDFEIHAVDHDALGRALLAGFPDRVARRRAPRADTAVMVGGRGLRWPKAALEHHGELLLALDAADPGGSSGAAATRSSSMLRLALGIDPALLEDGTVASRDAVLDEQGTVLAVRQRRWLDLVLDEQRGGALPDAERVRELLTEALLAAGDGWLAEQDDLRNLLARLDLLRRVDPSAGVPEYGARALAALAAAVCAPRRSLRALRKENVASTLRGMLPPGLGARLERDLPERISVPSGRKARIDYTSGDQPVLALRLQELFGVTDTPRILGGRQPLLLHILAPNQRPVQVTADLASFWTNHYPGVRSELRRRYPKHAWPEDPLSAAPQARPGRRRQ